MLYLISTPIGNLEDLSQRAISLLRESVLILCEDTRHTQKLLNRHQISNKTKSYHKFNEAEIEEEIIHQLHEEKTIALVSDAGTPCIADPGQRLVRRCHKEGLKVSSIPGPCALISALILFGFDNFHFQFLNFLPKKKEERRKLLIKTASYAGTTLAYESPNRLIDTLHDLKQIMPFREVGVARELTKTFEEVVCKCPEDLINYYETHTLKGECVIGISPCPKEELYSHLSPIEHVAQISNDFNLPEKEAIKIVANLRGSSKKELYKLFITNP